MKTSLQTMRQAHSKDACYFGDNGDWLIVYAMHRDSDCLARSNFRAMLKSLGGESDTVSIERSSHWAVGWVEYLIIAPDCAEKIAIAQKQLERIENYPVLDEDDFSEEEREEANEIWRNCYSQKERAAYIRKFSDQFEFRGLADAKACLRGEYFSGWASELIH